MFGSGNGKLKRRSFFLFGSDKNSETSGKPKSGTAGTPSHTFNVKSKEPADRRVSSGKREEKRVHTIKEERRVSSSRVPSGDSRDKPSTRSTRESRESSSNSTTQKETLNPLERAPLMNNSNPFINEEAIIPQLSSIMASSTDSLMGVTSNGSVKPLKDSNPFSRESSTSHSSPAPGKVPNRSRMSRPPPPPINPSDLVLTANISPAVSSSHQNNDTNTNNNYNEANDSNEQINNNNNNSSRDLAHRRQKSEAEKLVDDIEVYMKRESLSPERLSTGNLSNGEYSRPSITTNLPLDDTGSIIGSPYSNVMPLTVDSHDVQPHNEEPDEETASDAFSFQTGNTKPSVRKSSYESPQSQRPEQQISNVVSDNDDSDRSSLVLTYNRSNEDILRIVNADENGSDSSSDADYSYQSSSDDEPQRGEHDEDTSALDSIESSIITSEQSLTREPSNTKATRTLRVVNEDRPSFYLQSTNTNDGDTTTISSASFGPRVATESIVSEGTTAVLPPNPYQFPPKSPENKPTTNEIFATLSNTPVAKSFTSDLQTATTTPKVMEELQKTPKKLTNLDPGVPDTESSTSGRSSIDKKSDSIENMFSPKSENSFRLVSSYVEELRLKYLPTSNFLENPPNLPLSIKQKNNLIQPKNIKVKIRTNTKQVGIKHGRIKQKLLTLETTNEGKEDIVRGGTSFPTTPTTATAVDHTKEFRNLLHKGSGSMPYNNNDDPDAVLDNSSETGSEDYLNEIPGDDAYDSDDAMAPLREKTSRKQHPSSAEVSRNNTVISYYTRKQKKLNKDLEASEHQLPTNISMLDYTVAELKAQDEGKKRNRSASRASQVSAKTERDFMFRGPLHVANPDSDED